MKLTDIQTQLSNYIYQKDDSDVLVSLLDQKLNVPPEVGATVYRKNLIYGLGAALEETYPASKKALGDDNFLYFAKEYALSQPSTENDLGGYGLNFPNFLGRSQVAEDLPWIADLALFEWHWQQLYRTNQHILNSGYELCHSLRWTELNHDVIALWTALLGSEEVEQSFNLEPKHTAVVFWKNEETGIDSAEVVHSTIMKVITLFSNHKPLEEIFAACSIGHEEGLQLVEYLIEHTWLKKVQLTLK